MQCKINQQKSLIDRSFKIHNKSLFFSSNLLSNIDFILDGVVIWILISLKILVTKEIENDLLCDILSFVIEILLFCKHCGKVLGPVSFVELLTA